MVCPVVRNASKGSAIPEISAREILKYQTARLHKPGSHNINFHRPQNLKISYLLPTAFWPPRQEMGKHKSSWDYMWLEDELSVEELRQN